MKQYLSYLLRDKYVSHLGIVGLIDLKIKKHTTNENRILETLQYSDYFGPIIVDIKLKLSFKIFQRLITFFNYLNGLSFMDVKYLQELNKCNSESDSWSWNFTMNKLNYSVFRYEHPDSSTNRQVELCSFYFKAKV
ncbi:hypothetical protein BpHYR1_039399 [Brachionus plicatilis]|uniref:Uncharacterized protein n=1 Tax=Brachionus plicatilis TaxID=10195 RepID=A0A3M7SU93_BRAPC|nr:hypothetical protein BpHYR1_039399 [Brachionus plicatilis]